MPSGLPRETFGRSARPIGRGLGSQSKPLGRRLSVEAKRDSGNDTAEISDDGIGMPPDVRLLVFERFYRADPARARGGAGLGLSIAQWIANVHGAEIDLESEEGSGTTVRAAFPSGAAA